MIAFFLPFKGPRRAKSRWPIEDDKRRSLLLKLVEQNLETVASVVGADSTYLVSPDSECLEHFSLYSNVLTRGLGLNQDLEQARQWLLDRRPLQALGVLLPDLPDLCVGDVEALLTQSQEAEVTLCPDHKGIGTNSIVLRPPHGLEFCFEGSSYQRFLDRAGENGKAVLTVNRSGLANDCDIGEDLRRHSYL